MMGYKGQFLLVACLLVSHLPFAARAGENSQDGTADVTSGATDVGNTISPFRQDAGDSTEDVEVPDRSQAVPASDAAPTTEVVAEDAHNPAARLPLPGAQLFPQVLKTALEADPILAAALMLIPLLWERLTSLESSTEQKQVDEQHLRGFRPRKQAADSDSSKPADDI